MCYKLDHSRVIQVWYSNIKSHFASQVLTWFVTLPPQSCFTENNLRHIYVISIELNSKLHRFIIDLYNHSKAWQNRHQKLPNMKYVCLSLGRFVCRQSKHGVPRRFGSREEGKVALKSGEKNFDIYLFVIVKLTETLLVLGVKLKVRLCSKSVSNHLWNESHMTRI